MRALTIWQPWAWCIAAGHKLIENRYWATQYRGPVAIHAAVRLDEAALSHPLVAQATAAWWGPNGPQPEFMITPPWQTRRAVVAVAELVEICDPIVAGGCECGPWAAVNQSHWRLANVRRLARPVGRPGRQGLWTLPKGVVAEVEEQLR